MSRLSTAYTMLRVVSSIVGMAKMFMHLLPPSSFLPLYILDPYTCLSHSSIVYTISGSCHVKCDSSSLNRLVFELVG